MPRGNNYLSFILTDTNKITDFINKISSQMSDYIKEHSKESDFVVFYKTLTHSDIATFGKATKPNCWSDNLLYYISTEDMIEIENSTKKPFQTAHQSCIGLRKEFYDLIGLPDPRKLKQYLINDYMNVYLVNENMNYFTSNYTKTVFQKLGKTVKNKAKWNFNNLDVKLSNGFFTELDLHVAVHGLGMEQDVDFHKIRHHLFKGDTLILLCELNKLNNQKKLFVMFEKNPIFFSIIGEVNKDFVKYQDQLRRKLIADAKSKDNAIDEDSAEEVTRSAQASWRNMLANEMMGYTQEPGQIFCPLTYITIDYNKLGSLFVASHIKGFSDPNTTNEEKYDINNGLLICANADALFDKHLISIDENKELVFSFLLDNDIKLKSNLLLMQPIFKPLLNENRMRYLEYHKHIFDDLEKKRKTM